MGAGFIGLEMAENIKTRGIEVTLIEMANHVIPPMDEDMAIYVEKALNQNGVNVVLNDSVIQVAGVESVNSVILKSGRTINTDFVVLAVGVRPNTELVLKAGIETGINGAIKVNSKMQTNIDYVYACGDCTETYSLITGKPMYRPLGSSANKMGRVAGDQVSGGSLEFRGGLGTGIFKVFDFTVAQTGLTEKEANDEGYDVVVCHNIKPDKPTYYHGSEMVIKAVADKVTGKLLGVQIVGKSGVDKRIDVFATAITFGAKAEDLFHIDLAYAPPFSTTKDPVAYTGMILDNAINKNRKLMTAKELKEKIRKGEDITIIDARATSQYEQSHVDEAINIPQDKLREKLNELDKSKPTVTYCNKGVTGNSAQNILINMGFNEVYNLSGGHKNYKNQVME